MEQRTCVADGCSTPLVKKPGPGRWPLRCAAHRHGARVAPERLRASRSGSASVASRARHAAAQTAECKFCGGSLAAPAGTGPLSSYCSTKCRSRASYARRAPMLREKSRAASAARRASVSVQCKRCGAKFSPAKSLAQVYCSAVCLSRATADAASRSCEVDGCDRPHRAKGMCSMHWRRAARADGREESPQWDERRKANWQKRSALKRGAAAAERFTVAGIFERDGWTCGICLEPVEARLAWPDPMSASLDHVIPLSVGGAHTPENVQCAHLVCNTRKGARLAE